MPKNITDKWLENQGGRPRANINKEEFEKLCGLQCTENEICDWFGVVDKTLVAWCRDNYKKENGDGMTFEEVYAIKKSRGKIALRRTQMRSNGNLFRQTNFGAKRLQRRRYQCERQNVLRKFIRRRIAKVNWRVQ